MSHLSVATAIEKAKIASDVAFVVLLDVELLDNSGNVSEVLRICRNTENIVYQGEQYIAANFTYDLASDNESSPKLTINADDPSGFIRQKMQEYDGGVGFSCWLTVINTGNLSQPPEIQEEFEVVSSSTEGYQVSFSLGIPNPLSQRFPRRIQMRKQCTVNFKDDRCKYSGADKTCSYTYDGPNGCLSKGNAVNYGGFRGLQNLQ